MNMKKKLIIIYLVLSTFVSIIFIGHLFYMNINIENINAEQELINQIILEEANGLNIIRGYRTCNTSPCIENKDIPNLILYIDAFEGDEINRIKGAWCYTEEYIYELYDKVQSREQFMQIIGKRDRPDQHYIYHTFNIGIYNNGHFAKLTEIYRYGPTCGSGNEQLIWRNIFGNWMMKSKKETWVS